MNDAEAFWRDNLRQYLSVFAERRAKENLAS